MLTDFWTALTALAPMIFAGLAILGLACLVANGGIVCWIVVDQAILRMRARRRPTGCTLDDLMDGDDWARAQGYARPQLDEKSSCWLFDAPEFREADAERADALLFAAAVMADIDDLPGGDAA